METNFAIYSSFKNKESYQTTNWGDNYSFSFLPLYSLAFALWKVNEIFIFYAMDPFVSLSILMRLTQFSFLWND